MSIAASELKSRYQGLVAPGNDAAFYALLNEADERLLLSGRWHWARTPLTLSINADNEIELPSGYKAIVGARINGQGVGVNWQESEWFETGPGETIPIEGAKTYLVDLGLISSNTALASATINPDGADNSLIFTAVTAGETGNNISIAYAAPAVQSGTTVGVAGTAITVTPGTKARMLVSAPSDPSVDGAILEQIDSLTWVSGNITNPLVTPGGDGIILYTNQVDDCRMQLYAADALVSDWANAAPGTWPDGDTLTPDFGASVGSVTFTALTSSAQQVLDAVEASTTASALVSVAASGTITGAVSAVPATNLSGGVQNDVRTYRLSRVSDDLTEVEVLARYDSSSITAADSLTRCPHHGALKLMMMAIVYENASEESKAENYRAMAQRELDKHEAAYRGIAKRIYKPSLTQPLPRRSRTGFL